MIDLGISKLALIGAVALIVIGPEKLPRVARTVGALLGIGFITLSVHYFTSPAVRSEIGPLAVGVSCAVTLPISRANAGLNVAPRAC